MERTIVICKPLHVRTIITNGRAVIFCVITLFFSMIMAGIAYALLDNGQGQLYSIHVTIVQYFLPFFALIVLNTLTYFGVRRFKQNRNNLTTTAVEDKELAVTKMLGVVMIVFGICCTFNILYMVLYLSIIYIEALHTDTFNDMIVYLKNVRDILMALNSSVNFIIYYLWGKTFRNKTKSILKGVCFYKFISNLSFSSRQTTTTDTNS